MIRVTKLENKFDNRGDKYFIPREMLNFIGNIEEMHYVSVNPDAVRGNHVHRTGRESVILTCSSGWRLSWKLPNEQEILQRDFIDQGAYLIEIEAGIPHAFINTGGRPISLFCFSNKRYDPTQPDTERQVVSNE
ncbi:hypothetical protein JXB12_02585 [candidate division KSB1 bacterium]|nr:hypothetical protein [candidate division KSB1 bacterium]